MTSEHTLEYDAPGLEVAPLETEPHYVAHLGLMPTRDGLPEFQGETYDEHVEAWRAVNESGQNHLWALASIAASLVGKLGRYDKKIVARFAYDVLRSTHHIYRMAKTHTVFKIVDRSTILDFTLHLIAAVYADDPGEAIKQAELQGFSMRDLKRWIERQKYQALIQASPLPEGKHRIIYADPP